MELFQNTKPAKAWGQQRTDAHDCVLYLWFE